MATDLTQEFCALRDTYIEKQFGRLNEMQRAAVFTTSGPLLILAGAGSGKTTVLVNRIANLIRFGSAHGSSWTPREVTEDDVKALRTALMTGTDAPGWLDGMLRKDAVRSWNVMAITFTNKAAGELKERLRNMLGGEEGDEVFASTFHSACVRILRRWAEEIGYPRSFTIYDTDDSQRVMKTVYKELSVDDKFFPVKSAINQMSRWKDQLVSPAEALQTPAKDTKGALAARVYAAYEKKLKEWKIGLILPIPLHWKRKRKRGYNQAEILARELGKRTGIAVCTDRLLRIRNTRPLKLFDRKERMEVLQGAFAVRSSSDFPENILLIDDIYTSGSTMEHAAGILKRAGVQNVYFLTVSIGQER